MPTKTKKRLANLLFGTLMYLTRIDWYLEQMGLADQSVKRLNFLRILVYRLCIEKNSEPLQRIRSIGEVDLSDLLAQCRKLDKKIDSLPYTERLSIKYSFPKFFIQKFKKFFSRSELEKFLRALNSRLPYTWICVNTLRFDPSDVLESLLAEGYKAYRDEEFNDVIRVEELPRKLEKSSAYKAGMFIITEKASVATTHGLEPKTGDIILDMAAAPGIKLICTAFKMREGKIYAVDISESRMRRLLKLTRKYLSGSEIKLRTFVGDVLKIDFSEFGDANKILLDAECSSTGLIPKNPDIKLRITPSRLRELSSHQKAMLNKALSFALDSNVEKIIYSVCSFFPEEGEFVVRDTLNRYSEFFYIDGIPFGAPAYLPEYGVRFFPHIHKTIGFYIARIRKNQ